MGDTPTAPTPPPLTLGTAGHIDHGKTVLIGALTGYNTDRLPEERSRGISIELGYARLELPSGRRVSAVEVPGHERFVRTMVAGASGVDLFLMVVAADDGVMPQTREHAAVLRGLGIGSGVVAITKADLADPGSAAEEAAALLPDAESVAVAARAGEGLDELVAAIERVAARLPGRASVGDGEAPRLHVDRSFTIRGAGTVVTGTLWSGAVGSGEEVTILPAGRRARIRAVQVHDRPVERAVAGQRVALNLSGIGVDDVRRGDVVSRDDALALTYVLDAALELDAIDRPVRHGDRVQVHHGTRESPARVAALGGRFWQVRLEQPLVPAPRDRLVVRRIAPPDTLGGGVVLDPHARKHGPAREVLVRLTRLERGETEPEEPRPEASPAPAPAAEPSPLSPVALA